MPPNQFAAQSPVAAVVKATNLKICAMFILAFDGVLKINNKQSLAIAMFVFQQFPAYGFGPPFVWMSRADYVRLYTYRGYIYQVAYIVFGRLHKLCFPCLVPKK